MYYIMNYIANINIQIKSDDFCLNTNNYLLILELS